MTANLRLVWGNRNVRRVQLAYLGSETAVWIYSVALLVWTYEIGGAALVGTYAGIRLLFSAVGMPIGGAIADRMSRRDYLIAANLLRLPLVVAAAVGIAADLGVWVALVPGVILTMLAQTFRPAQAGLLPTIVEEPKELTAANATAETVQSITNFVGPAIGGLLVALLGPAAVVLISAVGSFWALALLLRVPRDRALKAGQQPPTEESGESFLADVLGGFREIGRGRHLKVMTGFYLAGGALTGVFMVVLVVVAGEWLGNPAAVGWMNGLSGVAAIVGGVVVLGFADRLPLARLTLVGCAGSSLALVLLGSAPNIIVIALAMIVIGLMEPATYIGLGTVPQRLVPGRLIARVVAAMNASGVAAAALGAFLTPVLIELVGLRWTLIAAGAIGTVFMLALGLGVPGIDAQLRNPRGLELLRGVSLFAPLSPVLLEQVVHRLELVEVGAGSSIVREGEQSDRFYIIESGSVTVSQAGEHLRSQEPGEVFGEIGLLRDITRTATVSAQDDTTLLALPRTDFLAVLGGNDQARALADELAQRRLAAR